MKAESSYNKLPSLSNMRLFPPYLGENLIEQFPCELCICAATVSMNVHTCMTQGLSSYDIKLEHYFGEEIALNNFSCIFHSLEMVME